MFFYETDNELGSHFGSPPAVFSLSLRSIDLEYPKVSLEALGALLVDLPYLRKYVQIHD